MDSNLIPYQPVISDIKNLIAAGQNVAYNAANRAMIMTYWNIGKRIVEEEQSGAERAEHRDRQPLPGHRGGRAERRDKGVKP